MSLKIGTDAIALEKNCGAQQHSSAAKGPNSVYWRLSACLCSAWATFSFGLAEPPVIAPGGIVNAAAYTKAIVPGSIMTIFGANLADAVYNAATTPLPTTLGGTSVSIDGIPAPLFFVSPSQINAQVPFSVPFRDVGYSTANVIVTTPSGKSAPAAAVVAEAAAGVFTTNGTGCGPAVALNVGSDGSLSPNSPANSIAPGDFIMVFGTGFGLPRHPPADGSPAPGPQALWTGGGAGVLGGTSMGTQYYGLAPNLVGINQANFQIPLNVPEGCAVPLVVGGPFIIAPTVSISIRSTRGQCVDPPTQSYGTIALVKTITIGTDDNGETDSVTASFPSGPLLSRPPETQTPVNTSTLTTFSDGPLRACPVAGYEQLSAGVIRVSGPSGSATMIQASTNVPVTYSQKLPQGFVGPGAYSVSADGSPTIGAFARTMTIDPPINIISVPTRMDLSKPYTVRWSGGSPGTVVKVSLRSPSFMFGYALYGYAPSTAGSFTFEPTACTTNHAGKICQLTIPGVREVVFEQIPATDHIIQFQTSGITGNIQASYTYKFVFGYAYLLGTE